MRQLIAGNWKMNGLSQEAAAIVGPLHGGAAGLACDLLVCPPFTQIVTVAKMLAGSAVAVGGQDCHPAEKGAHTGDISAVMLRDAGASWVILGHSERRQDHHENDALIQAKTNAAIAAGLTPIVCVGETEVQRVAGEQNNVVGGQLSGSLPAGFSGVVAYEPVWAIGTGKTATEDDVAAMHLFIRETLVRPSGRRGPNSVWRLGSAGERGGLARGAACGRRPGRRRQFEGGGVSGDRQSGQSVTGGV